MTSEELKLKIDTDLPDNSKLRVLLFRNIYKTIVDFIVNQPGSTVEGYEQLLMQVFGTLDDPELETNLGSPSILEYMLKGIKVKYVELPNDFSIDDYTSNDPTPVPMDIFFEVKTNEIIIFKQKVQKNDSDVFDGWELYMCTKGAGKWGVKGETNNNPDILPCYIEDFVQIYRSYYANEITFSNFEYLPLDETLLAYASNEMGYPFPNVHQAMKRVMKDAASKLETINLQFFWGLDDSPVFNENESDLQIARKKSLGIKIPHWDSFQNFITMGGTIEILMYRWKPTNKKGRNLVRNNMKNSGYVHETRTDISGRVNVLPVSSEEQYYDFRFEQWFSGYNRKRRTSFSKALGSEVLGEPYNTNKYRKMYVKFKLRFTGPGANPAIFTTPLLNGVKVIAIVGDHLSYSEI
jgi:hypothetical protein